MTEQWADAWANDIASIKSDVPYDNSATRLRALLKKGLLRHTDLRNNPERFFLAHRLLARHATSLGPGFWIRFTVQYNLFAGTVLGLGGPDQVALLDEMQEKGELGCFGLTERLAGVNSGLVVNTTITWHPEKQQFLLNCPNEGSYKNWISQGLTADKAVVMADLTVEGKSHGPHAFLMDFRRNGQLVEGVTIGDMGVKTIGNDLDNAWISFNNVWLPKSAMLDKFCSIEGDQYVQKVKDVPIFSMIGQRLFSGRVAVAQAALEFGKSLFESTKHYSDDKKCWSPNPGVEPSLSTVPQLVDLYAEADAQFERLSSYVSLCEKQLSACLRADTIPSLQLIEAIAVAKVKSVEDTISLCFRLKQDVGSFALMGGTGFEQMDFLQCCKFAEGDSRILMQKMVRDRLKALKKGTKSGSEEEARLCSNLAKAAAAGKNIWIDNYQEVYTLAELIMTGVMGSYTQAKSKL
jgi:acyl-CoA oxidase